MKNLSLLLFFFFCLCIEGYCQGYNFDHFTINEGLSNNAVLCSVQDKNGFLWFGTKDGLNRFDGYTFKKYFSDVDEKNGLGTNYFTCLLVDQKNRLWVGTDNGLYKFLSEKDSFVLVYATRMKEITEIQQDKHGKIWFISNHKLFSFDPNKSIDPKIECKGITVTSITKNKEGEIWYSTHEGIFHVDQSQAILFNTIKNIKSINVEVLFFDQNDNLWVGTQHHGLLQFDQKNQKLELVLSSVKKGTNLFVRDIKSYNPSELWIASESGLIVYHINTKRNKVYTHEHDNPWSIADNAVYSILKDHQGGVWVGSFFGGISYFHQKHNLFERRYPRNDPNSISGNAVREIREDANGNLWVGTEDNGLNLWNIKENSFQHFSTTTGLSHNNIHGLEVVGDSLLIGTFNNGLDILSIKKKRKIAHYNQENTDSTLGSNFIMSAYKTKNGRIFLTSPQGLYQFLPGQDKFLKVLVVPDSIFYTSILEDKKGRIWLTTWRDGVYILDSNLKKSRVYKHDSKDANTINSNRTNKIQQDSEGKIWIATENGLTIWDENSTPIKSFTKSDGLPSNLILSMQEDSNKNMWLSTTNGLISIEVNKLKLSVYNKEFGMSNLQFNYNSMHKDKEGFMYFGSTNGLIKFHPDSLLKSRNSETKVPIYFTSAKSSKRPMNIQDTSNLGVTSKMTYNKLVLDYDESTLEVDFAALNYVDAASTSYLFKLKGFDSDWILSRNNVAYYTKLPTGNYRLLVKAIDSQGRIISDEISLPIEVKKPFWASNLAFLIYSILLILIIFFIYQYFDGKIKDKNRRRLLEINANRERRLYQTKLDFFTQVAHDIKTPLTLIKGPLEKLVENRELGEDRTFRLLTTMQKNTDKLVRLTNSILDFRKVETGVNRLDLKKIDISGLIQEYVNDYQSSFQIENINFQFHINPGIYGFADEDMISKIVENLFSNALKYSDRFVEINLYLKEDLKCWILEVKNDGPILNNREIEYLFKPFHRSMKHSQIEGSGLGLALSHSFALLHEGDLRYVENSEKLNIFVLAIPLNLN